ncbi:hypothetical protein [Pseudomonas fontis]|uniref:Uncharacterized protein n=1 Tax=Pseudomonas fontis TaxID=2942633 RepID=A0ABT5NRG9_9PSED|nr:hypothetical protein [Pseudomonas fontis]MDD0977558.1 hypothetical protein [Pseudomonas fontis]MDD0990756.1 hypothetical protein [Pseudomonas fontis]
MTKQTINLGVAPNGAGGDDRRSAWLKAVANFDELYAQLGGNILPAALPVAKGGTGGTTPALARTSLGLGSAATATVGIADGNVLAKGAFGLGGSSRYVTTNPDSSPLGGGFHYYGDQTGGASAANNRFGIRFGFGTGLSQGFELLNDPWTTRYYLRSSSSNPGAPWYTPVEIYTTGNTTRAADGTLKAI